MKSVEEVKSMIDKLQKTEEKLLKEMDRLVEIDNNPDKLFTSEQLEKYTKIQNELKNLNTQINTLEWVWGSNKMEIASNGR